MLLAQCWPGIDTGKRLTFHLEKFLIGGPLGAKRNKDLVATSEETQEQKRPQEGNPSG